MHKPKRIPTNGPEKRLPPLPYMRWFENDFQSNQDVRRMSRLCRLMYRSLLQNAWTTRNAPYLPDDDAELEYLCDAPSPEDWQRFKPVLLAMFKQTDDGRFYHPKTLAEYDRARRIQGQHSEGAKIANNKRWSGRHGSKQSAPYDPTLDVRSARKRECQ